MKMIRNTAWTTKKWHYKNHFNGLEWLSQSPDLEHIRRELKPTVSQQPPLSGQELYGVGQNLCCSVCEYGQDLKEMSRFCFLIQTCMYQIMNPILISFKYFFFFAKKKMLIHRLKILILSQLRCTYIKNYRPFCVRKPAKLAVYRGLFSLLYIWVAKSRNH